MIVRDDPGVARRGPDAPQAWERVRSDVADWTGDALVSHEFFCAASAEQAERMVAQLAPAEVHVVVTAREPLGLFTSQLAGVAEEQGHDAAGGLRPHGVRRPPRRVGLAALDLGLVLERWAPGGARRAAARHRPAAAPAAPREELWERFAGVLGIDPATCDAAARLRQLLDGRGRGRDAAPGQRAADRLRHRPRPRRVAPLLPRRRAPGAARAASGSGPPTTRSRTPGARGARAVERIRAAPYDVVGDLDLLLVPDDLPPRRHPDSVTDAEVADVALDLVATPDGRPEAAYRARRRPGEPEAPASCRRGCPACARALRGT